MGYIAVDLGSTNIKVAVYGNDLKMMAWIESPVPYIREGCFVEFDALNYSSTVIKMIASHVRDGKIDPFDTAQIVFTGQAESLVVLGRDGIPLMNAISWMDERSMIECGQIAALFPKEEIYRKTGQMAVLPTWPATKILWLQNNRRDVFDEASHYVMLKDYLVYCLTGSLYADCSIATFTFYFDIHAKEYWKEMLLACGIRETQLPPLIEPCTNAGALLPSMAQKLGLPASTMVNVGTLDHFAGMIGTGNIHEGIVSLSIGTVMALATIAPQSFDSKGKIALHHGFMPDTHVFLQVVESGGVCLEWYREHFMKGCTFQEMDARVAQRPWPGDLIFLPFITGTNAPDFDKDACGIFYGIRSTHDVVDFAYAVMEGVAHLLARNIDVMSAAGLKIVKIIATGGGAKSDIWCQIQADVTGVPVEIPSEKEAACLGAAIIGAVNDGAFENYEEAVRNSVRILHRFEPKSSPAIDRKRKQFAHLYKAMMETVNIRP